MSNVLIQSLILLQALAASPELRVERLDGRTSVGTVQAWTAEAVVLRQGETVEIFPLAELASLSAADPPAVDETSAATVTLRDGSRLAVDSLVVAESTATLRLTDARSLDVPLEQIESVQLAVLDEKDQQRWREIQLAEIEGDALVVRKSSGLDYVEGRLGAITQERVWFVLDGEEIPVRREKVMALRYFHSSDGPSQAGCRLTFVRGEVFAAAVRLDGDDLEVETAGGLSLRVPLASLLEVDYASARVSFLSDMQPTTSRWTPYVAPPEGVPRLATYGKPRFNRAQVSGYDQDDRLRLSRRDSSGGRSTVGLEFDKGISLRSRSELSYRLPQEFKRLTAIAGIEPLMRDGGHLRLIVRGDEQVLLDEIITGIDDPRQLELDLRGVKVLQIVVDYGEDQDIADVLNLCDVRLWK